MKRTPDDYLSLLHESIDNYKRVDYLIDVKKLQLDEYKESYYFDYKKLRPEKTERYDDYERAFEELIKSMDKIKKKYTHAGFKKFYDENLIFA